MQFASISCLTLPEVEAADGTTIPIIMVAPVLLKNGFAALGANKIAFLGIHGHAIDFFTVGSSFMPTKHLAVLLSIYISSDERLNLLNVLKIFISQNTHISNHGDKGAQLFKGIVNMIQFQ
jgi:hypothetical protein